MSATVRSSRLLIGVTIAVVALAALLRFAQFGNQLIIDDEWHALHSLMRLDFGELFQRFGHSDHSIPIALALKAVAETIGLTEWRVGFAFLLVGTLSVLAVPRLLGQWLGRREQLALMLLLAISPLLIYFARQARPYALVGLLIIAAAVWLWQFSLDGDRRRLAGFVAAGALAAWLHMLMLAFIGWLLVAALVARALEARISGTWSGTLRVIVAGTLVMSAAAAVLVWPLRNDFAALQLKAATHTLEAETVWIAWQLYAGTGRMIPALLMLALGLFGAIRLIGRDRMFWGYLVASMIAAVVMITATGATWISHGLVLARYALPLQFVLLAFVAVGLVGLVEAVSHRIAVLGAALVVAACALIALGPLPEIRLGPNAQTKHMYYQFDYRPDRNKVRVYIDAVPIPPAYARIAEASGPGRVIEAGWWYQSTFNPTVRYQSLHGRRMKVAALTGLCADAAPGEPAPDERFRLNNIFSLAELPERIGPGDFVVFTLENPLPRKRARPDQVGCIEQVEAWLGPPWYADEQNRVYRQPYSETQTH